MSDDFVMGVDVGYQDSTPQGATVSTRRQNDEYEYYQEYEFRMDGSTAVLTRVSGDGGPYLVRANEAQAEAAEQAMQELPFVQAVVMFDD